MRKVFILLLALLLFSQLSFAQVSLSLEPVGGGNRFYQYEVKYYRFTVQNDSASEARDVKVLLKAPPQAALVVESEERSERLFSFLSIPQGAAREKTFEVKAVSVSREPVELVAEYGVGNTGGKVSTQLDVSDANILLEASFGRQSLKKGERSEVTFSLQNNSQEPLTNVSAELFSTGPLAPESGSFELAALEPGKGTGGQELSFSFAQDSLSPQLVLRVFFNDSGGAHVLEKSFEVEVSDKGVYVIALVIIVLVLVLTHFLKKKIGEDEGEAGEKKENPGKKH